MGGRAPGISVRGERGRSVWQSAHSRGDSAVGDGVGNMMWSRRGAGGRNADAVRYLPGGGGAGFWIKGRPSAALEAIGMLLFPYIRAGAAVSRKAPASAWRAYKERGARVGRGICIPLCVSFRVARLLHFGTVTPFAACFFFIPPVLPSPHVTTTSLLHTSKTSP